MAREVLRPSPECTVLLWERAKRAPCWDLPVGRMHLRARAGSQDVHHWEGGAREAGEIECQQGKSNHRTLLWMSAFKRLMSPATTFKNAAYPNPTDVTNIINWARHSVYRSLSKERKITKTIRGFSKIFCIDLLVWNVTHSYINQNYTIKTSPRFITDGNI